ncbi:MAG TPA: MarR family winged helix-turn-helix transcriptional regulator [Streptosporangiaceae bacterium]|nr:MarR family winged helix-turn-helix transcriptional regulator [Streptosporangiaceae bacterium]
MPHPEQDAPLARLLGLAARQMAADLNDKLLEAGATGQRDSWNNVMPHIPPAGIRLTDLAARANMTKQAMAELVAEIERRGYLQRAADPADRRAKIIKFTDQGWATVNLALSALGELEAEIAGRLGEPAIRQLRGTLLQILDRPAYTRRGGSSGPSA